MKIGNVTLPDRAVMLAPMEDVTDVGFRLQCRHFGADMVYSEFVSADALIRSIDKTMKKLRVLEEERPVVIQIYGRLPRKTRGGQGRWCRNAARHPADA